VETGPLPSQMNDHAVAPVEAIKSFRKEYQKLFLEKMRAPDGGYEDGLTIPGTNISPPRTERTSGNLDLNNPLSLHDAVSALIL
jgi:TBC1 domain family member 5